MTAVTHAKLKKSHQTLLAQYNDLLNQVSKLPFFSPVSIAKRQEPSRPSPARSRLAATISFPFALRYLVRLFTESHIRGKLIELSVAYSFLAQEPLKDKRLAKWLKETSADCEELAATLTSWQSVRGIVGGLWPIGVGVVTASLNLQTIYDVFKPSGGLPSTNPIDWLTVAVAIFPLIYVLAFLGYSFQKKREMFMHGFVEDTRRNAENPPETFSHSVYHLEDELFTLLDRGKAREFPGDIVGQASGLLGFAILEMTQWIVEPAGLSRNFFAFFTLMFLIGAIFLISQLRWRKFR